MGLAIEIYHSLFPSVYLTSFICILIICTCVSGDYLVFGTSLSHWSENGYLIRAMIDNATHAIIGALVWALIENDTLLSDWKKWLNCICCALLAASVDLDHFIAAESLDFKKAMNLPTRPPFHNTSVVLVVALLLWILQYYRPALGIFSLMFLSSCLSHHLRDANHRGLWLFPFGHTAIFPSYVYVTLILLLGSLIRILYFHNIYDARLKHEGNSTV